MDTPLVSAKPTNLCNTLPDEQAAPTGSSPLGAPTANELHQMTGKRFSPAEFLSDNFIGFAHKNNLPLDYEYIISNSSFAVRDGTHLKLSEGFALKNCVFVSGKLTFYHGHIWVAGPHAEVILKGNARATATAAGAKIIVASSHATAKTNVDDAIIINLATEKESHAFTGLHYPPNSANPALIPSKTHQDIQRRQEKLNRSQGGLTHSGGKALVPKTAAAAPAAMPADNPSWFEKITANIKSAFHSWPI